ncbi:MAG: RDD family protein [Silicimonas sp.]|nr:RDD family protein [Silicimonas sp.]NNF92055.1 RDD family protein [Boseongicola sp.]RZW01331.1 MAG: RDD family protein [Paracoccaceae bacterium]MBT8426008.1 RDD family protein [Silicimonas sp.]NND22669.1 RDD family protein [Silicimonas sp.]
MTHSHETRRDWGLPDPQAQPEFYEDVPTKRLLAWVVDTILIGLIVAVLTLLSIFTALFVLPLVWGVVSFLYRWLSISTHSATPGMRLMSVELRRGDGTRFDGATAFLHTAGYVVSVVTFPLQLISIVMMLMTERKQGLTDMVLGTAAINRSTD